MPDSIAILDFGSQYSQLIARRIREAHVYCELFPWDISPEIIAQLRPKGFILSGGPDSVYTPNAPQIPKYILESGLPILGICYGMQALIHALGGRVSPAMEREFGYAEIEVYTANSLLPTGSRRVWMSHGDRIEKLPAGFVTLAKSSNSPTAAVGDLQHLRYGVQFHPEVKHTQDGAKILQTFVYEICGARPDWTPQSIINQSIQRVRDQVGDGKVLAAVSGGVDSSVATALVHRAIGDQLSAVFVNTGLLRQGEVEQVESAFKQNLGIPLETADATADFLKALEGITDPEKKRKVIGEVFIRRFEAEANRLGKPNFLVQGTIYPDVVESSAPDRSKADRIKSHHNVGGLPKDMAFKLVEPLRYLFKDEVRTVGLALGLPAELIWRQPFPGPGLAVRCLGEVTPERLARLRSADAIFTGELAKAGLLHMNQDEAVYQGTAQAFAVLLPVHSVGVMGDQRTYQETIALRAVTTDDFMTADWAHIPADLLARVSSRIVNEVDGVNRVVYDITSKPPATIEWE
jgi:GMP synthase (glutamine-hydrolysing)